MTAHPIPQVQGVAEQVGEHLHAILKLFKPSAKIAVLVRRPDHPDGSQDFLLTNDNISDVIKALQIRNDPASQTLKGDV